MSFHQSIALPAEAFFDAANEAAEAWRGRCLGTFAKVEMAVSETLLAMSADAGRGKTVDLPLLIGPRNDMLGKLICPGGAFHAEGKVACTALQSFLAIDPLRAYLSHATTEVSVDRHGRWIVLLRLLAFRGGQPDRSVQAFREDEADLIAEGLERAAQRLLPQLGQVRATLAKPAVTKPPAAKPASTASTTA